jgi:hypothetical protein
MNRIDDIKARLAAATPGSPERCHYQNTVALADLAYLLRIAEEAARVAAKCHEWEASFGSSLELTMAVDDLRAALESAK